MILILGAEPLHLTSAMASESNIFIVPPRQNAVAGHPAQFTLFIQNTGTEDIISKDYASVMVALKLNGRAQVVEAIGVETGPDRMITVPAGGFAKLTYEFKLPRDMAGTVSLSLEDFKSPPVLFAAGSGLFNPKPGKRKMQARANWLSGRNKMNSNPF